MADTVEHAPLIVGVLDLFHLDNLSFFQNLHGIEAVVVLRLNQVHTTKTSRSQCALQREVLLGIFPFGSSIFLLGIWSRLGTRLVFPLSIGCAVYYIVNASSIAMALGLR